MESLEDRLAPATSIWSGAIDNLWSTAGNWDTAPTTGSDLVFPITGANLTNNNDLSPGTSLNSVTIAANGYNITGNSISLAGTLTGSLTTGTSTLDLPIDLPGNQTVNVAQAASSLSLTNVLSGSGGITKTGPGSLVLSGDNTYAGATTISGGSVQINGNQPSSAISLASGTFLSGTGTVGTITATAGGVNPGISAPGILTDTGSLNLDTSSSIGVLLNGIAPGTGYSQLSVAGPVNLNNAALHATLGFTPTPNETFTILDNTGSAPINGTFAGLPEGSVLTLSGRSLKISYTGGTGNDVVLTALQNSTTTLTATPTTASFGDAVTLKATVAPGSGSGTPTGSVQFFQGSTSLGTGVLTNGVATLTTTKLPVGTDPVTATYLGDTTYGTSTSSAVSVTISKASTTTSLTSTPNPSASGQSVTLTATVAGPAGATTKPSGTVTFLNGTTSLGTGTLNNGVATLAVSKLAIGSNSITASYGGDASNNTSTSSAVTQTVVQGSTTTSLTASSTTPVAYQMVTLTATVSVATGSGTPSGSVEFFVNGLSVGTATISSGKATLNTNAFPIGTDSVKATYQGDSNFTGSSSSAVSITSGTNAERVINQIYLVSFGRPAGLTELDAWRTQLITGKTLHYLTNRIIHNHAARVASANMAYQTYLGRPATHPEIARAFARPNASYVTVDASILGSSEYYNAKGGGTNSGYLTALYKDVVGTTIPAATLTALENQLNSGVPRQTIAENLLISQPGRAQEIASIFQLVLGRAPTTKEATSYVSLLETGTRRKILIFQLLNSTQFKTTYPLN